MVSVRIRSYTVVYVRIRLYTVVSFRIGGRGFLRGPAAGDVLTVLQAFPFVLLLVHLELVDDVGERDGDVVGHVLGAGSLVVVQGTEQPAQGLIGETLNRLEQAAICLLYTSPSPRDRG